MSRTEFATDGEGRAVSDPRSAIALACRVLGAEGHEDLSLGHVSIRDPEGRGAWIKARGKGLGEVTPEDVILINWEGQILEGDSPGHSEFPIHTEIMLARPGAGAVVHTHARPVVAWSSLAVPILPISHEGSLFSNPQVPRFEETTTLITSRDLGRRVASTMGEADAVVLVNHGIATTGEDVEAAVMTAVLLNRACQVQLLASSAGEIRVWSSDEDVVEKRRTVFASKNRRGRWQHLLRHLDRNLPENPGSGSLRAFRPGD